MPPSTYPQTRNSPEFRSTPPPTKEQIAAVRRTMDIDRYHRRHCMFPREVVKDVALFPRKALFDHKARLGSVASKKGPKDLVHKSAIFIGRLCE